MSATPTSVTSYCNKRDELDTLDREDLLALAVAVDDVLDFIEEFTIKPVDYCLAPDEALQAFFGLVSMAVAHTADGIACLRDLQSLEALRAQMRDCEHRADDLERALIKWILRPALRLEAICMHPSAIPRRDPERPRR